MDAFDVMAAIKRHVNPLLLTDHSKQLRRRDKMALSMPGHHLRKTRIQVEGTFVRGACEYCKEQYSQKQHYKVEVDKWDKEVGRTVMVCNECDVYMCHKHLALFHR